MHTPSTLARREGFSPLSRAGAFLLLLVLSFFVVNVVQTQREAHALAVPPIPVVLPAGASISGGGIAAGTAAIESYLAGSAAAATYATTGAVATGAATATGAVAVAPVAVAAGAVILAAGAVYLGWKWLGNHSGTEYDPPPTVTQGAVGSSGMVTAVAGQSGFTAGQPLFEVTYVSDGPLSGSTWRSTFTVTSQATNSATFGSVNPYLNGSRACANYGAACTVISNQTNGQQTILTLDYNVSLQGPNFILRACANSTSCSTNTQQSFEIGKQPTASVPSGTNTVTTTPTARCQNSAGTVSSVAGTPVTFTAGTANGALPPLLVPACPSGQDRVGVRFPTTSPGITNPPQPLADYEPVTPSGFPECAPIASCQLNLFVVGHATGARTDCGDTFDCLDWQTEFKQIGPLTSVRTAVGTIVQSKSWVNAKGDRLECQWGPYIIDAGNCTTVRTGKATNAPPVATPPNTVPGAGGSAPEGDEDGERCYPTGWAALNPLEWVVKPLKCLFIPEQAVLTAAGEQVSDAWTGTAPAVVAEQVEEVVAPVMALKDDTGPANCQGPTFTIPQLPTMDTPVVLHPLSTCNELTTYLLGIYMPIATALVYIGGFFAGTRVILKAFNLDTGEAV